MRDIQTKNTDESGAVLAANPEINPIRLMLVDDHPSLRMGLRMILERETDMVVVAECGTASQSIELHKEANPNITIMDIKLGDSSGIDAVQSIRAQNPKAKIIFLTGFDRDEDIYRCIRCGAVGFIVKDTPAEDILSAIRLVHQGRKHFPSIVTERLSERLSMTDLSDREYEVLKLMTDGRSNKEIASDLGLAVGTVKYHVNNILAKLQVDDRTQAVVTALRKGLVEL